MLTVLIPGRCVTSHHIESDVFGESVLVVAPPAASAKAIAEEMWASADAVLAWHDFQYDAELIAKLTSCRVLVRIGVGTDNVDLVAAGRSGIAVYNVPDYGTADVADHAMALLLSLARGVVAYNSHVRGDPDAWSWEAGGTLRRLSGRTMGIVGLGRIGTATERRARSFGIRTAFYDPYLPDGYDKALDTTRFDSLGDLLTKCDIVSMHTPLTDETRGMCNDAFFEALPPGSLFINTARGPIVDIDALHRALSAGRLAGAGLDVLPEEPPDPAHPLILAWRNHEEWLSDRLIVTPHAAFFCDESYVEMRRKAAVTAKRALEGEAPPNCVNERFLKSRTSIT